jgi:hypothetical protein
MVVKEYRMGIIELVVGRGIFYDDEDDDGIACLVASAVCLFVRSI